MNARETERQIAFARSFPNCSCNWKDTWQRAKSSSSNFRSNVFLAPVTSKRTFPGLWMALPVYWAAHRLVGRVFVSLLSDLATWPSQPANVPTAKARLATYGAFSEKSLQTSRCATQQVHCCLGSLLQGMWGLYCMNTHVIKTGNKYDASWESFLSGWCTVLITSRW